MTVTQKDVEKYYDKHSVGKLSDFVYGNGRIETAWKTILEWGGTPQRILEVGCGVGAISWRMATMWPDASVCGIDASEESIRLATDLFSQINLSYEQQYLVEESTCVNGKFDLIVLMDVYEHIALSDRLALHTSLKRFLSETGRVVLTFPTPRHLEDLRQNHPQEIQPVDEDVTPESTLQLASDLECEVLMYKEVGVWRFGDYAHAVIGHWDGWQGVVQKDKSSGWTERLWRTHASSDRSGKRAYPSQKQRMAMVRAVTNQEV